MTRLKETIIFLQLTGTKIGEWAFLNFSLLFAYSLHFSYLGLILAYFLYWGIIFLGILIWA